MIIQLPKVRLAFPQLFEAKQVNGEGEPAFSASFLIDPDAPVVTKIRAAMEQMGKEKWGAKWPAIKKELEAKDRFALHDGNMKASYAGFEGNLFISARNKSRPLVIDRDKTPLVQADGRPYAGCFVNGNVELWCQDNKFGKRINAGLQGIQFHGDGDAFAGGGVSSTDDFDEITDGADAGDFA